jgi:protein arginine N-methyltransferase 7
MLTPRQRIADAPSDVQAWTTLAGLSYAERRYPESLTAFDRALALRPDPEIKGFRRMVLASIVPGWHFPMLRDKQRNDAYATAIARQVRPEHHVLEIGTGSGLLAMLCARGGARHVTTCEMVPEIAATARRVIDANGLADRIDVLSKHSRALEVGVDVPEAGDVLISEIIANDFLSEGVLGSVADARHRLLNSDAIIIPAAASIRVALVSADDMEKFISAGSYDGLDLSTFDRLSPAALAVPDNCTLMPLSEPYDAFAFDFLAPDGIRPYRYTIELRATATGRCHGVVQWIRLDLGAGVTFESTPFTNTRSHWLPMLYTFPEAVDVKPGDIIRVLALHEMSTLVLFYQDGPTT